MRIENEVAEPAPRRTALVAVNIDDYESLKIQVEDYRRRGAEIEEQRRAFEASRIKRFRAYVLALDAWMVGGDTETLWSTVAKCRAAIELHHDMEGATK